jgi:hypothetical protein
MASPRASGRGTVSRPTTHRGIQDPVFHRVAEAIPCR